MLAKALYRLWITGSGIKSSVFQARKPLGVGVCYFYWRTQGIIFGLCVDNLTRRSLERVHTCTPTCFLFPQDAATAVDVSQAGTV